MWLSLAIMPTIVFPCSPHVSRMTAKFLRAANSRQLLLTVDAFTPWPRLSHITRSICQARKLPYPRAKISRDVSCMVGNAQSLLTADNRQQTANSRQQTANSRQQDGDFYLMMCEYTCNAVLVHGVLGNEVMLSNRMLMRRDAFWSLSPRRERTAKGR